MTEQSTTGFPPRRKHWIERDTDAAASVAADQMEAVTQRIDARNEQARESARQWGEMEARALVESMHDLADEKAWQYNAPPAAFLAEALRAVISELQSSGASQN